jgi:hypothetical protein
MGSITKEVSLAEQLIAGTKKHFSTATSLAFGGATYTPAQVESSLQTLIDLRTAVDVAKAATQAKLVAWRAQSASLGSYMAAYEAFLKATYGKSPDVLADFGLKPKKVPAPQTAEQKAAAAAKRAATRAARHTMGSQQKKSVKGTVPATVATTPPAASAPVAQPAPPATHVITPSGG